MASVSDCKLKQRLTLPGAWGSLGGSVQRFSSRL